MRYYIVDCELGVEKFRFMVKAGSKAAARKWVTDKVTEASIASQDDLVNWLRSGMSIEDAEEEVAEVTAAESRRPIKVRLHDEMAIKAPQDEGE